MALTQSRPPRVFTIGTAHYKGEDQPRFRLSQAQQSAQMSFEDKPLLNANTESNNYSYGRYVSIYILTNSFLML